MPNKETYELEKTIWTEQDFAVMGWHDATLWAMVANSDHFEYLFDLDYIFKWVPPTKGETFFTFWVAPVTMVFENARDINIDIESPQGDIEIADLHMEHPQTTPNGKFIEHTYQFECQEGEISLRATGFKMYVRQKPILLEAQGFDLQGRNGISFERTLGS